jgi:Domain of unknown function (DUF4390)
MLAVALASALPLTLPTSALAQPVELVTLQRSADPHAGIAIDYAVKLTLPKLVVETLQRGVPVHFVAQASVIRPRWYWRDDRVARATRVWRVAYQPLTASWRVTQGPLTQNHATLDEALASMTRATNWLIVEPPRVEPDERYIVTFNWSIDTSQLPPPMQLGLGGANSEWNVKVEASFGVIP